MPRRAKERETTLARNAHCRRPSQLAARESSRRLSRRSAECTASSLRVRDAEVNASPFFSRGSTRSSDTRRHRSPPTRVAVGVLYHGPSMAEEAAAAAADPPLSLQRQSAAAGAGGAASSNDMDAIRGQPALADRLQSLQLDDDHEPDRTQPHPAPVASTSSSSSPRLSLVVEPDLAPQQPGENPQPTKRKVVLLKRPATPTNRTNKDRDRRSDEPTSSSDPIDRDYSSHSQENSGSATTPASPYGTASPGDLAETDSAAAAASPALDPVLHGALNHPRDRFLLLRAEVELERFILNQTCVLSNNPRVVQGGIAKRANLLQ